MRSLTFISIIISVLFGQFDNSGTSAANFLKIGVGGRAAAMGGAIVGNIAVSYTHLPLPTIYSV